MNSPEYKCKLVVEEGAFITQDGKKIPIEKGEYQLSNEVYEIEPEINKDYEQTIKRSINKSEK